MSAELTEQEQNWLRQALGSHRMRLLDVDGFAEELEAVITAHLSRARIEWAQRANEGLSASVLAAKAEAWDEGRRHVATDPDPWDCTCRNPYRDQP